MPSTPADNHVWKMFLFSNDMTIIFCSCEFVQKKMKPTNYQVLPVSLGQFYIQSYIHKYFRSRWRQFFEKRCCQSFGLANKWKIKVLTLIDLTIQFTLWQLFFLNYLIITTIKKAVYENKPYWCRQKYKQDLPKNKTKQKKHKAWSLLRIKYYVQ